MKTYAYKVERYRSPSAGILGSSEARIRSWDPLFAEWLNHQGADGWLLVDRYDSLDEYVCVFAREQPIGMR